LITTSVDAAGKLNAAAMRPANASFAPVFTEAIPSIRRHKQGSDLYYTYSIYNATGAAGEPELTREIRLFRDGKLLMTAPERPILTGRTPADGAIDDLGSIRLSPDAEQGEYVLQVIVRDKAANKTASQWIDFEVIG
jgi:hypothetical protein